MMPKAAELWAFATELETIWLGTFILFAPQLPLAVWFDASGDDYGRAVALLIAGTLIILLLYVTWGAARQKCKIKSFVRDGLAISASVRNVPTFVETLLRAYTSVEPVICESVEERLVIELPVRQWAIRDGAVKTGQTIIFIVNRDRDDGVMLRPEYLAYLDKHSASRLSGMLEGTRNGRLSSEVLNSWVDVRGQREDQAIAS